MYSDLNCFSLASIFSFVSFFIITSLSISIILIYFSETSFSFAWFFNLQKHPKKYGKSISFGIIAIISFILLFLILLILFLLFLVYSVLLFYLDFLFLVSITFSWLSITVSRFSISLGLFISLGFNIFLCQRKKRGKFLL